jgi:hypothetical protein
MTKVTIIILITALLTPTAAIAGDRPLPVPQQGHAGCAPGYSLSPVSRTCTPTPGTRARAFPAQDSTACPAGWSYSPTSRMCLEAGR